MSEQSALTYSDRLPGSVLEERYAHRRSGGASVNATVRVGKGLTVTGGCIEYG